MIATSNEETDDQIEDFAAREDINCFRGSLSNVSLRLYSCAKKYGFDYAIRINGDNIFVDIELLQKMISIAESDKYEFISNVKNRTFPKGMSIEMVRVSHYGNLLPLFESVSKHKEHVTTYLYENEKPTYHFVFNQQNRAANGIQMALDTEEDLVRTQRIISNFKSDHWNYNLNDIIQIWKEI